MNDVERDNLLLKMDAKIDGLLISQTSIKAVLFDVDGSKGLCSKVDEVCNEVRRQHNHIFRLWLAVVVLGSTIGGGAFGVIKLLTE